MKNIKEKSSTKTFRLLEFEVFDLKPRSQKFYLLWLNKVGQLKGENKIKLKTNQRTIQTSEIDN